MNHLGFFWNAGSDLIGLAWGLIIHISNKVLGDSQAAGAWATLWRIIPAEMKKNTINSIVSQSTFVTGLRARERTALSPIGFSPPLSGDSSPAPTCFLLSFWLFGDMSILQTQFRKPHLPPWVWLRQPFLWTSLKFHAAQY